MAPVGDAAHPMLQYLAQGACRAFEDAAHKAAPGIAAPDLAEASAEAVSPLPPGRGKPVVPDPGGITGCCQPSAPYPMSPSRFPDPGRLP